MSNKLLDFGSDTSGVYPISIFTDDIQKVFIDQDKKDKVNFRLMLVHYDQTLTVVYVGDYKGVCASYYSLIHAIAEAREVEYENAGRS